MHTAVRTKVPLKKKARAISKKKSKTTAPPGGGGKENASLPVNTSSNTATSPTFHVMAMPSLRQALAKRQQKSSSTDSPRKLLTKKKKKQQSSSEESTPKKVPDISLTQPAKPNRKHKKQKGGKLKEVIDYSNPESHSNTFGKVQKWLLESPVVSADATAQIEHESKVSTIMSKSQSNPEHLAVVQQRSPSNSKMKSTTNINDKVRLQVVYKPPFKFSLKFSKKDPTVKTKVIGIDRTKRGGIAQATVNGRVAKRNSIDDMARSRRAALLVRSATEEIHKNLMSDLVNEPIYETLNPKVNQPQYQRQKSSTLTSDVMMNYENVPSSSTANLIDLSMTNSSTSPIVNTATYRVNKSASGGNIHSRNLPIIGTPVLAGKPSRRASSHKGSQQNLSQTNTSSGGRRSSISNSSSNLTKLGGSSQNLVRSSTTNLTKGRHDGIKRRSSDMNRSSTTNLNKYHRQHSSGHHSNGSSSNLRRGDSNMDINSVLDDPQASHSSGSHERRTHSRKNSVNNMSISSKNNLPRTCSNSNLMSSGPHVSSSRRESFNNNIPRASLVNPSAAAAAAASTSANSSNSGFFSRHVSMKPTQLLSQHSRRLLDEVNKNRPQTSSCDSSMFKNFEWPKVLSTQRSVPANNDNLGSDMEVLHSDVENLVTDS